MPYPYDDYPPPPRGHRNSYHLNPDPYGGDPGLRRSNSRGRGGPSGPAEIHIHNDMYQEGPYSDNRDFPIPSPPARGRSPYRGYPEPVYGYPAPIMYPPPDSSHSRSRGRYEDDYWRKRAVDDYKREEEEREKEKEKAIEEHEMQLKKEKEEEKERQKEAIKKYEQEKKDKEAEQKKHWEEYEERRKAKEREEKEKKEKEDEEYRERFRKHLAKAGYSQNQIDAMIEAEKQKQGGTLVRTPSSQQRDLVVLPGRQPVYPKIRRTDIAVETLKFYDLKWRYDESNTDFIIILQEMSERETDVLFAHTARLKEKGKATVLQIEDRGKGKKPQYMMVRRRSKSRDKSPSGRERLAEAVLKGTP